MQHDDAERLHALLGLADQKRASRLVRLRQRGGRRPTLLGGRGGCLLAARRIAALHRFVGGGRRRRESRIVRGLHVQQNAQASQLWIKTIAGFCKTKIPKSLIRPTRMLILSTQSFGSRSPYRLRLLVLARPISSSAVPQPMSGWVSATICSSSRSSTLSDSCSRASTTPANGLVL